MTDYSTKANVYSITLLDNERHSYHTNEKTIMWREVFSKHEKYIDAILKPTEIYEKEVMKLIDKGVNIKGIAQIPGGGLSNLD